jgi:nitroreductase
VLAGAAQAPSGDLDLAALARLLHLSSGVTRYAERRGRRRLFRAAGSAGARFPLELYVAVPGGDAHLPAGVHWYHPADHALVRIGPPPLDGAPSIVVTGIPWRTGWRYRERGFRHLYWDAGTMLAQLLALADSAGLAAHLYSRFPDAAATELVGADGIQEFPLAVVALGRALPALAASGRTATGAVDDDAIEFPLVTAAQHAGDMDAFGAPLERGAPVAAADAPEPLDEVILRRGSVRRLDPDTSVPRRVLETAMAAAMRAVDVPHWVVVHAVDDLAPGLYRWPDLSHRLRDDVTRAETYRVALEQSLAGDAAFVVVSAVDLESVDDRGYREVQLLAGLVEGRLHLAAYALGVSATGMTFQDADIPAFLGEDVACLLWTCVGVADYRAGRGGAPGAPTTVRMVMPKS